MRPTILVVEDDADVRWLTVDALKEAGFEVLEAADGEAAIDRLSKAEQPPALIVLDALLPKLDGPGVVSWLKERPAYARIPILLVTGASSVALPGQVSAVLRKPHDPERLISLARALTATVRATGPARLGDGGPRLRGPSRA